MLLTAHIKIRQVFIIMSIIIINIEYENLKLIMSYMRKRQKKISCTTIFDISCPTCPFFIFIKCKTNRPLRYLRLTDDPASRERASGHAVASGSNWMGPDLARERPRSASPSRIQLAGKSSFLRAGWTDLAKAGRMWPPAAKSCLGRPNLVGLFGFDRRYQKRRR